MMVGIFGGNIIASLMLGLPTSLYWRTVWEQIMADSLRVQFDFIQNSVNGRKDAVIIAIQGVAGSNSHQAAIELTPNMSERELVSCTRFGDAITAVKDGRANLAVLPIENTTSGAIAEVYDLLLDSKLSIVGEAKLLVKHCLLGVPGATVAAVRTNHITFVDGHGTTTEAQASTGPSCLR